MTKSILITGGAGKVGSQLIKHFWNLGWNVLFTALKQEEAMTIEKAYCGPSKIKGIVVDLEREKIGNYLCDIIENENIFPDCLVNCARNLNYLKIASNGQTLRSEWHGEFNLNIVVAYELAFALVTQHSSKLESIINISSMYGVVPPNPYLYKNPDMDSPIQYGVTKAALIHLTKELAVRFADKKVRVNAISFGGIEGRVNDEFKIRYSQLCPLKRMLKENEVVGAVEFLATDKSTFMTGHNLIVDGGWSVW